MNVWKDYFTDPRCSFYKSSRVEKIQSRANAFYRKAVELDIVGIAKAGDKYSQDKLGNMFHNGRGVDQNYSKALELYRKATEQGHADAQDNLGYIYGVLQ